MSEITYKCFSVKVLPGGSVSISDPEPWPDNEFLEKRTVTLKNCVVREIKDWKPEKLVVKS